MLINTVVLFLRDTLPIFLLISVLLALPRVSTLAVAWRVLLLVLLAIFIYPQLGLVSQLSEGAGFEYLKSILFLLRGWVCALLYFCRHVSQIGSV